MKEIKFRAWDKDNSKMVDVVSYEKNYETKEGHYDLAWRNAYENENFLTYGMKIGEECEVMQYVGLKDKHAKEIYEGDIVKILSYKLIVYNGKHSYNTIDIMLGGKERILYGFYLESLCGNWQLDIAVHLDEIEIIGNIYENPELLGDSQ